MFPFDNRQLRYQIRIQQEDINFKKIAKKKVNGKKNFYFWGKIAKKTFS